MPVIDQQVVQCGLCPKECIIPDGYSGDCRIRVNINGRLVATTYGFPCAVHIDPIEKKPMNHFLPGSKIFSIATVGCNLHCKNCQNWEISQCDPENSTAYYLPPENLVKLAIQWSCPSIAYTYTEPLVYYEYTLDSAKIAKEYNIKNILVTAGYINPAPAKELLKFIDGANIDLKAFSDKFYREICDASLKPVLDFLVMAKISGVIVEVTNLIIPTLNDSDKMIEELCKWIVENMGKDTPLHFSRFYPHYKLNYLPPTPADTLIRAKDIAKSEGLHFVYIGNIMVEDGSTTFCPSCQKRLIVREGYTIISNLLKNARGKCPQCQTKIYGLWE